MFASFLVWWVVHWWRKYLLRSTMRIDRMFWLLPKIWILQIARNSIRRKFHRESCGQHELSCWNVIFILNKEQHSRQSLWRITDDGIRKGKTCSETSLSFVKTLDGKSKVHRLIYNRLLQTNFHTFFSRVLQRSTLYLPLNLSFLTNYAVLSMRAPSRFRLNSLSLLGVPMYNSCCVALHRDSSLKSSSLSAIPQSVLQRCIQDWVNDGQFSVFFWFCSIYYRVRCCSGRFSGEGRRRVR